MKTMVLSLVAAGLMFGVSSTEARAAEREVNQSRSVIDVTVDQVSEAADEPNRSGDDDSLDFSPLACHVSIQWCRQPSDGYIVCHAYGCSAQAATDNCVALAKRICGNSYYMHIIVH